MSEKLGFEKKDFGWMRRSKIGTTVIYNDSVAHKRWCRRDRVWMKRKSCKKCQSYTDGACKHVIKKKQKK